MFELIRAGGLLMLPLVILSIVALAIISERVWRLRTELIIPEGLTDRTILHIKGNTLTNTYLTSIANESPLGAIIASIITHSKSGLDFMTAQTEQIAASQIHKLEKHLTTLGTVAYIAPLLGLLGTVLGIIQSFMAIKSGESTDPALLAQGISVALITTAAGMFIAIPATIALRYFQRRITTLATQMEQESAKIIQHIFASKEQAAE